MNKPTSFPVTYSFDYFDGEDRSITCKFSPGDTWPEVLEQFVGFLGNVYGYDIRAQVAIKKSQFSVYDDSWSGPVFNPEESL
jgi:hypothetical protein